MAKHAPCPTCGRQRHLKPLRKNFPTVDLICKFCGHLAQVKAATLRRGHEQPTIVLGAAWTPVREQIEAGIFHDLYVAGYRDGRLVRIERISAETLAAHPQVIKPRNPLSATARRAGWQGLIYDLTGLPDEAREQVYP